MEQLSNLDHLPLLKQIRESKGVSREQLCDITGYSENTIKRAEGCQNWKNSHGIGLHAAIAISEALDVSVDELIGRTPKLLGTVARMQMQEFVSNYKRV